MVYANVNETHSERSAEPADDRAEMIFRGMIHETFSFNERVWALCSRIPAGKVVTYGCIARKLGSRAYRAVGHALNRNPYAPKVPCHRVVGSAGQLTGYAGGVEKKQRMLLDEGVTFVGGRVDLKQHRGEL